MPGLQASRSSTPTPMENTALVEQTARDGAKSPRGQADLREFAEKMAIFARYSDRCSSGSEHQPDSACLVDMVLGFMEASEPAGSAETAGDLAEDRFPPDAATPLHNEREMLEGLANGGCPVERIVMDETIRALQMAFSAGHFPENEESKCRQRRAVMNHLRGAGYNAAVCKSRGKYAGSFPSGDYEYIDVEMARRGRPRETNKAMNNSVRLVVDIDFRAQFEIARPTGEYSALVRLLPEVFVGRAERLQQIIRIMCVAAKGSLKRSGMHLPPWRKHKYMQSKWLGPYKRTTNPVLKARQPPGGAKSEFGADGDGDAKLPNSEGCAANIYYGEEMGSIAGWKPPQPSVERPGRVYSALANALKEAHGLSAPSQLHLSQDRIPLTVF